jgi:hypothetical protein
VCCLFVCLQTIAALEDHIAQYGVLGLPHEAVHASSLLSHSSLMLSVNNCFLQTIAALEDHIAQYGVLGLPHEAVRAVYGLPPSSSLMGESRSEAIKAVTPKYNQTQVCDRGLGFRVWVEPRRWIGLPAA